jgi:uncharacterized BrkB/YihY/UPF0761 family membrane protein
MAPEGERRVLWSQLSQSAVAARSALQRRGSEKFARLPRPLQQAFRLIERTARGTLDHRVPGLAAEAALFTLISLPALLLAVIGSLGFVAAALGPQGTSELRELVLGVGPIGALLGAVALLPPMVFGPRLLERLAPAAVAEKTLRMLDLFFWPGVVLLVLAGVATLYHVGVPWRAWSPPRSHPWC